MNLKASQLAISQRPDLNPEVARQMVYIYRDLNPHLFQKDQSGHLVIESSYKSGLVKFIRQPENVDAAKKRQITMASIMKNKSKGSGSSGSPGSSAFGKASPVANSSATEDETILLIDGDLVAVENSILPQLCQRLISEFGVISASTANLVAPVTAAVTSPSPSPIQVFVPTPAPKALKVSDVIERVVDFLFANPELLVLQSKRELIAHRLNQEGITTPSGKKWNIGNLNNYRCALKEAVNERLKVSKPKITAAKQREYKRIAA